MQVGAKSAGFFPAWDYPFSMVNDNLADAKSNKFDEFYTSYSDIQLEINAYLDLDANIFRGKTILLPCDDPEWSNFTKFFAQNFESLGLKKIISTSFARSSKEFDDLFPPTDLETSSMHYDPVKSEKHGRIFTLELDNNSDKSIDYKDLSWEYLSGTGDFLSEEVSKLRDEADFIITNPPFSLFKEFLKWIIAGEKNFIIIGNMHALTYKETFSLVQKNRLWLGATNFNKGMYFYVPSDFVHSENYKFDRSRDGLKVNRVPGVCWMTNVDHGRRHSPLKLMTMEENVRFSSKREVRDVGYSTYDNYDALEVPWTECIPSDYSGVMGVPITFMDKYNPDQFEIVGASDNGAVPESLKLPHFKRHNEPYLKGKKLYKRIFIKKKN